MAAVGRPATTALTELEELHDDLKNLAVLIEMGSRDLAKVEVVVAQMAREVEVLACHRRGVVAGDLVAMDEFVFARSNHEQAQDRLAKVVGLKDSGARTLAAWIKKRARLEARFDAVKKELDAGTRNLVRLRP